MKKLSQAGFTLMEIMVGVGILGLVTMIIMSVQNKSQLIVREGAKNQEITELLQRMNSELTKTDACKANFEGKTISSVSPGTSLTQLVNGSNKPILKAAASSTDYLGNIKIDNIYALKSGSKISITVNYTYKNNLNSIKQDTTQRGTTTTGSIRIGLNVFSLAATPNVINSCFSDTNDLLIQAVKYACQGTASFYEDETVAPPYGRCTHKIELQNSAAGVITGGPSFNCPDGELLVSVLTNTGAASANRRILKCAKVATNTTCGAWQYMSGIDTNGNAVCNNILDLFSGNGFLGGDTAGNFTVASVTCPAGTILRYVGANFASPTGCINPSLNANCPTPGQYVDTVNADGSVNCKPYPDNNACAAGNYATAINNVGVVTCGAPTLSGSCGAGYAVNGTTAGGAVTCTAIPL